MDKGKGGQAVSDMVNVSICDGKYTIIQDASGRTKLLRYGEPWRWVTGDNVILGAAYEIEKLQERIKQLEDARTVAAANSLANMLAYEDAVAKIKRLVEAGDYIVEENDIYIIGKEVWQKAKEFKP